MHGGNARRKSQRATSKWQHGRPHNENEDIGQGFDVIAEHRFGHKTLISQVRAAHRREIRPRGGAITAPFPIKHLPQMRLFS